MFSTMMDSVKEEIIGNMFRSSTTLAAVRDLLSNLPQEEVHDVYGQFGDVSGASSQGGGAAQSSGDPGAEQAGEAVAVAAPVRRHQPKIGRNAPCPCGSGKKYKHCCGR